MNRSCCPEIFICIVLIVLGVSCKHENTIIHTGENHSEHYHVEIDTIRVSIENSSGQGNFYLKDSIITFVDAISCTFYDINLQGQVVASYFGKGRGENEIRAIMYAYPIENDPLNRAVIVDNDYLVTIFDRKNRKIEYSKKIDFGLENRQRKSNQYNSPSLYKMVELTDFGMSFYLDSDGQLIFPVNIYKRATVNPDKIDNKRYEKGAILGKLNLSTMKVESVMGRFPEIFKYKPMPHMESFQYTISNDLLYVNHAVDSLIYVYKYPDDLQYTIGYECSGIDRNYTSTKMMDQNQTLKNDLRYVGFNSGLFLCPENNTLCRAYMKSAATGESGLQVYKNNDLIADVEMPAYFKLLGYKDGYYYGARLIPIEDLESTNLILYKIKIERGSHDDHLPK